MQNAAFYRSRPWRQARLKAIHRDRGRCTVGGLLGTPCGGTLDVHHITPITAAPHRALDPANLASVCHRHHPAWEAIRRQILAHRRRRDGLPRCPHQHRTLDGRLECEARLARKRHAQAS